MKSEFAGLPLFMNLAYNRNLVSGAPEQYNFPFVFLPASSNVDFNGSYHHALTKIINAYKIITRATGVQTC